jgi:hypothetical protein
MLSLFKMLLMPTIAMTSRTRSGLPIASAEARRRLAGPVGSDNHPVLTGRDRTGNIPEHGFSANDCVHFVEDNARHLKILSGLRFDQT